MNDRTPPTPAPFPDLRWDDDRATSLATFAVGLWRELLERLPSLPVSRRWKDVDLHETIDFAIPAAPSSVERLRATLRSLVFDASMYPGHPRFMAFITGPGTIPGVVADFVAAMINQNVGGWRLAPAATEIEVHLTRWFGRRFGLPDSCGGLMCSGGAMANFIALKAMRDAKLGVAVRDDGVIPSGPCALYASAEVHDVVTRGADMLGLGAHSVRKIPVDSRRHLQVDALVAAIAKDRVGGVRPLCVVGSAGTVSTGAVDPLAAIADVCAKEDLWFHVDGAYGALAILSDELRPLLSGIERADSIAFDPHKWLYVPHSAGCVVVRDLATLRAAFALHPSYVREDKARTGHGEDLHVLGPQFSRGFQALKVWLSLVAHGSDAYGKRIGHDAALARHLAARCAAFDDLEALETPELSICCFRYVPMGAPPAGPARDALLDALNERLMTELQLDGRAYCSNAVVDGRFWLRACIVNFRTEAGDVEALLQVARELGAKLEREVGR